MLTAPPPKGKIVVTGMCFYLPLSGVIYQVLHYLIGLRSLGYDAYYVEDSSRWVFQTDLDDVTPDARQNVRRVASVLEAHGFAGRWAFRGDYEGGDCFGMDAPAIDQLYHEADALLNVTGQELREAQLTCRRRIYIESDPFATQVRVAQGHAGERSRLTAHDTHFSFGENLGAADCSVPVDGFNWLPTRQPVALELWEPPAGRFGVKERARYTTITSWVNHVAGIDFEGDTYHWQKGLEFEKFMELPRRRAVPFELAATVWHDVPPIFCHYGWDYLPADSISFDTKEYREYIWGSRAEFTVARDQYVRPRTGWFSDRSACYLAAARPVITQETGFSKFLPTGQGLFAFSTMDEIVAAVDLIEADYERHCEAAREIAVACFAAEKVVGSLMERSGLA